MSAIPPSHRPHRAAKETSQGNAPLATEGLSTPRAAGARAGDLNGIYGTRSANRRRMAQRRRIIQNLAFVIALSAACVAWLAWQRGPREAVAPTIWSRDLSGEPSAAPALIAAQGKFGAQWLLPTANGHLIVADANNGRSFEHAVSDFGLRASVLARGENAFIAAQDGALYALNWRSGKTLWRFRGPSPMTTRPAFVATPPDSPATASVAPTPTAAPARPTPSAAPALSSTAPQITRASWPVGGAVVAADDEGVLTALSARAGKVLWRRELAAPIGDAVVVARDGTRSLLLAPLLAGASSSGLRALNARDGHDVWRYPTDEKTLAAQVTPPVVDAASGHVFCSDDAGAVTCLSLHTGRQLWRVLVPPLPAARADEVVILRCGPTIVRLEGGATGVVVGGNDGGVRYLDAATGRLKWSRDVGGALRGALPVWSPSRSPHPLIAAAPLGAPAVLLDAADGHIVARLPQQFPSQGTRLWLSAAGDYLIAAESDSSGNGATLRALAAPNP